MNQKFSNSPNISELVLHFKFLKIHNACLMYHIYSDTPSALVISCVLSQQINNSNKLFKKLVQVLVTPEEVLVPCSPSSSRVRRAEELLKVNTKSFIESVQRPAASEFVRKYIFISIVRGGHSYLSHRLILS